MSGSPTPRHDAAPIEALRSKRPLAHLLGLIPVLLAGVVYLPILAEYFKGDDFLHLYEIANLGLLEFLVRPHGGHLLISSNLVFYLCYRLFGLNAAGYQWVALLTHLLNVWLLYHAIRHFTGRPFLAAFGASFWGMGPMAYGSLSWFSVYGHVLAGTGIAWILCDVARRSRAESRVSTAILLRWYAVFLAAAMTFGVGLGVAAAAGPILFCLRPRAPDRLKVALWFATLLPLLVAIFKIQHWIVLGSSPPVLGPLAVEYAGDSLQAIVALFTVGVSTLLLGPLAAIYGTQIAWGPLAGTTGEQLLGISYAVAALAAGVLLVVLVRSAAETRSKLLGLGLVIVCAYGLIAVYRAQMFPLVFLATSSRYHYVAPMAMTVLMCLPLGRFFDRIRWSAARSGILLTIWAIVATPCYAAAVRSFVTNGEVMRGKHEKAMAWIESQARQRPVGSEIYLRNQPFLIGPRAMPQQFPGMAAVFVLSYPKLEVAGHRIFFIEPDPSVLAEAEKRPGSRLAQVLVSPREAAQATRREHPTPSSR